MAWLTVKNPDDFARTCPRIPSNYRKIKSLGENIVIVKISDISELTAPQEQTKILGNQLVHGSSGFLSDSVKNSDSSSAGWQKWVHNTPQYASPVPGHTGRSQTSVGTAALPALAALAWS